MSFCRASRAGTGGDRAAAAGLGQNHADDKDCPPDLKSGRVSAFLLKLSTDAKVEDVRFAIAAVAEVKIIEGNSVLTSSRHALDSLLLGIGLFAVVQLVALLIVVSLLFSAVIQERYREIGLLRAMGARPSQIMTMILVEATVMTGLGGIAGLGFGVALLLIFARSLGFYFGLIGIAFAWPPLAVIQGCAVLAIAFSAAIGLAGALLPAWRARRVAPYTLILSEVR